MWRFLSFLLCSFFPLGFLFADTTATTNCTFEANQTANAAQFLKNCAQDTPGIPPGNTSDIKGVKERIANIAKKVIQFGALFAVGALVFAGIQYTTAYGDDEKLKHAKTTGIFAVVGLLLLMASFGLVDILVRFIYELVGNT
ncbi:MAG: hypothetical protein HHAS10_07350 [Candidatus Altimarinota bacterium]